MTRAGITWVSPKSWLGSLSVSQFPHWKNRDFSSSQPALLGCQEETETVFPEGWLSSTDWLPDAPISDIFCFILKKKKKSRKLGSRHSLEAHTHLNISRHAGSFSRRFWEAVHIAGSS